MRSVMNEAGKVGCYTHCNILVERCKVYMTPTKRLNTQWLSICGWYFWEKPTNT